MALFSPALAQTATNERRLRTVRVPGHLNNAQLERLLFGRADGQRAPQQQQCGGERDECTNEAQRTVSAAATAASASPPSVQYPLCKQLAVFVVRDVARLCSHMRERVSALMLADDSGRLRALAAELGGGAVTEQHEAFRVLVARLVARLTGVQLDAAAVAELVSASARIARQSLTLDTRTRRLYLLESYEPGADNVSQSDAVRASGAAFSAVQARSWYAAGQNPLRHLALTYPIQALQRVGRQTCSACKRKSQHNNTQHRTRRQVDKQVRLQCAQLSSPALCCVSCESLVAQSELVLSGRSVRGVAGRCAAARGEAARPLRHVARSPHTAQRPPVQRAA